MAFHLILVMKRTFALFFACIAAFGLHAQKNDTSFISRLASEILVNGEAYENLRVLTKEVGARLAGSPQMQKAEEWGFTLFGKLRPDNLLLQACEVPHWVRGGKDEAIAYETREWETNKNPRKSGRSLAVLALGNSVGSQKPIAAPVIEIKSFEELEKKKDSIRGKIVFYNYPFNQTFIRTFQAYGDAVQYRVNGASRAAKYGAVAVIVRSLTHSTDNLPHTGTLRYDSAYPMIPAVAIGLHDADWLSKTLQTKSITIQLWTHGQFLPKVVGHNVIAELRGSEFPNEIITVGAHLDSWDVGEGAHDDGAGCVQTIEILRAFKVLGYKPKRTIRFVLFANEENGLAGGLKYAEDAKNTNERHVFALESDAGGFSPRGFGFSGTDAQFEKIMNWQPLLAPYGATDFIRGGGGADIGPLQRNFETAVAGLQPDSQRYFDYHHAASDVFEAVNKRELLLGAVNMAALIYLVDQHGL